MPQRSSPAERAQFLADWVLLRLPDFETCYHQVYSAGQARSWAELVADADEHVVADACTEAVAKGFLERLAEKVAEREAANGRAQNEIREMLAATAGEGEAMGEMHAILDQFSGLMDETAVFAAADALRACAMVFHGSKFKGTAFLVRPDMVLTAAHVVLGSEEENGEETWSGGLAEGLSFSFRARDNHPATERVTRLPAPRNALRKFSRPFGTYPRTLFVDTGPPAEPTFDYALIQLAQSIEHVNPIGVDPPATVENGNKCWAIGFPGGSALKLDVDRVVDDKIGGGRWIHVANAAPGMSGGCCINHLGKLAGVHEGEVELNRGDGLKRYNRSIGIAAIRQDMLGGKDPMTARSATPGVEFDDPELVANLWRAGAQLSGPAEASTWDAAMRSVFPAGDPSDLASLPGFHPWFERRDFKAWITSDKPRERLCLISGERGAGASFCKQILRASLNSAGLGYFEVSPTQVVAFSPAEALGVSTAPTKNRTSAANFRYNDASELIAQMRSADGAVRKSTVAIDFGPAGGPDRLIGSNWQEFIARLVAEEWIRVVLIGLRRDEQIVLGEGFRARTETESLRPVPIELAPISPEDFEDYAIDLRDARGARQITLGDLSQRIASIVGPTPNAAASPALQTAKFALAAILLERGLTAP